MPKTLTKTFVISAIRKIIQERSEAGVEEPGRFPTLFEICAELERQSGEGWSEKTVRKKVDDLVHVGSLIRKMVIPARYEVIRGQLLLDEFLYDLYQEETAEVAADKIFATAEWVATIDRDKARDTFKKTSLQQAVVGTLKFILKNWQDFEPPVQKYWLSFIKRMIDPLLVEVGERRLVEKGTIARSDLTLPPSDYIDDIETNLLSIFPPDPMIMEHKTSPNQIPHIIATDSSWDMTTKVHGFYYARIPSMVSTCRASFNSSNLKGTREISLPEDLSRADEFIKDLLISDLDEMEGLNDIIGNRLQFDLEKKMIEKTVESDDEYPIVVLHDGPFALMLSSSEIRLAMYDPEILHHYSAVGVSFEKLVKKYGYNPLIILAGVVKSSSTNNSYMPYYLWVLHDSGLIDLNDPKNSPTYFLESVFFSYFLDVEEMGNNWYRVETTPTIPFIIDPFGGIDKKAFQIKVKQIKREISDVYSDSDPELAECLVKTIDSLQSLKYYSAYIGAFPPADKQYVPRTLEEQKRWRIPYVDIWVPNYNEDSNIDVKFEYFVKAIWPGCGFIQDDDHGLRTFTYNLQAHQSAKQKQKVVAQRLQDMLG